MKKWKGFLTLLCTFCIFAYFIKSVSVRELGRKFHSFLIFLYYKNRTAPLCLLSGAVLLCIMRMLCIPV